ncbi:zf-HC2 domain-containing protein [Mycobacterium sp. ITM-2016-00317]|uniref:anti-sigma factor family protein n=1 Tax=Mycobacterium sp. ITM-2016-00317 TaxID=2099694 RepID=UPI00287FE2FE|nr:zf-HC2 domain-containing protein [Mycobacterium sp. ITM-2016-00317]WNG88718.1 zf-HC2 domain-containing protein [Mycobacterium sp. ITM-2016-00317]
MIRDHYLTWDAAYVLGALADDERVEYEHHLVDCERCRSAVAELSDMPALLGMLDADDVDALYRARARRRRTRWLATVAVGVAAAVLAATLVLVLVIRPEPGQSVAQMQEMTKVADTPINASIAVSGYGWGTRIDMACSYGEWGSQDAPPQNLGMVVIGHDGSRNEIATWLGVSGATALPSATTPMEPAEIAAVQLVSSPDGKVLLERRL